MAAGAWFWIIYIVCGILGGFFGWSTDRRYFGGGVIVFVLIGLLGWHTFGSPLK